MSRLYGDAHRALQDEFETRALADGVEGAVVRTEIVGEDADFIGSRDLFFLSTVDHKGRPTVSYKGGAPGFVKVINPTTLVFPSYDGNGMFLSMGNLDANAEVGLLFIDFEKPNRRRVQGLATIERSHPLRVAYPEADFLVQVTLSEMWVNCPRYVHRYERVEDSEFVPREGVETPFAPWKRIDVMQSMLSPADQKRAAQAGLIGIQDYQP